MTVTVGNNLTFTQLKSLGFTVEQKDGQYTVTKDGITVVITPSDTVWDVNQKYEEAKRKAQIESRKPENNEEYKKHRTAQIECSNRFDYWIRMMQKLNGEYNSFLTQNGVKSLSDLTGDKKKEGMKIYCAKSDAVSNKNAALQ